MVSEFCSGQSCSCLDAPNVAAMVAGRAAIICGNVIGSTIKVTRPNGLGCPKSDAFIDYPAGWAGKAADTLLWSKPAGEAGASCTQAAVPFEHAWQAVSKGVPGTCRAGAAPARKVGYLPAMSVQSRNNVHVSGAGPATMFFAHGFGCDQNMWRLLEPAYRSRYRTVLFDLVGSGASDPSAYDSDKYSSLQGYADDVMEIVREFGQGPALFVGHSVSAMIGMLANLKDPGRFGAQIMIGPSPCYINDGQYVGGFSRADIEGLLETLESNYLGWSSNMAPAIMGAPDQPELGVELTNSFCRTDPEIAKQFARVTFLSDNRTDLPRLSTPVLIVQCNDDMIAPMAVGEYLNRQLPHSTLSVVANVGHCPHLSSPSTCSAAIDAFLAKEGL
jgi:sigma-B regulation protein RsbQ